MAALTVICFCRCKTVIHPNMSVKTKKCGVQFDPPALVLLYSDGRDTRRKTIPLRNFKSSSDISKAVDELCSTSRYQTVLSTVSRSQLHRLLTIVQLNMQGVDLDDSLKKLERDNDVTTNSKAAANVTGGNATVKTVDSQEDLNKLSDDELAVRKAKMDEVFEKNRKKFGDNDYTYEVNVEFEPQKGSEWDSSGSDHSF
jgi:centrosomal protein CEP19